MGKVFILVGMLLSSVSAMARPAGYPAVLAQVDSVTERWGVFELTISDANTYANPFWDVSFKAAFISPGGTVYNVNGFYYDSILWKIRFSPSDTGTWTYQLNYTGQSGLTYFTGQFKCTSATLGNHGYITPNPALPHTFIQSDGTPFVPLGNNGHTPAVCAAFLGIQPGTDQVPAMWDTLAAYNVNSFRLMMFHQPQYQDSFSWNPQEGSANLLYNTPALDQYDIRSCLMMDRWLTQAQSSNIAMYICMMAIFDVPGYPFSSSPWSSANGGPYSGEDAMFDDGSSAGFTLQQKYMQYVVARWGAYRNIVAWEYNNEFGVRCSEQWLAGMDSVIGTNDPYARAHTVSVWNYEFSDTSLIDGLPSLQLTDDHCYETDGYTQYDADSATNNHANYRYSTYQKPVMFGEFGSGAGLYTDSDYNYERVAYWGALTGGAYPLYWLSGNNNSAGWAFNMSTIQFLGAVNKIESLVTNFTSLQPNNSYVSVSYPDSARAYCLADSNEQLIYVHYFASHADSLSNLRVRVSIPNAISFNCQGTWINATTGEVLSTFQAPVTGSNIIAVAPTFMIDELLLLKESNLVLGINQPVQSLAFSVSNYPNPFTESVMFSFSTQQTGNVTLRVYDATGQLIDQPLNSPFATGDHLFEWTPAKTLSSGMYYYTLQSTDGLVSKKMIHLK